MTNEEEMIAAHQQALLDANEHFAVIIKYVLNTYPHEPEVQFSYIAGYIQQLRRNGEKWNAKT